MEPSYHIHGGEDKSQHQATRQRPEEKQNQYQLFVHVSWWLESIKDYFHGSSLA